MVVFDDFLLRLSVEDGGRPSLSDTTELIVVLLFLITIITSIIIIIIAYVARPGARLCLQIASTYSDLELVAKKTTHSLDGPHPHIDRTPPHGRVSQNEISGESASVTWPNLG